MASENTNFQEGLYAGLGLALRAKEKVEEFGKKISEDYQMNEEQGKKFMEDLVKQSEETQTRLDEIIESRLETYMKDAGVPTKKDLDKLSKKLDELDKKIESK
ncbi:MAG: phasin family protein [Spirochaetia bacterium]